jgi:hypothetical protein
MFQVEKPQTARIKIILAVSIIKRTERAYSAEKATKARSDINKSSIFNSGLSGLGFKTG